MVEKLVDFDSYAIKTTLKKLLKDKSTKKNIIWATNTYAHLGDSYKDKRQISENLFLFGFEFKTRKDKSEEAQIERTRDKAEVFTPSWIVNQMNNHCDEDWFARNNIFNIEKDKSWEVIEDKIQFSDNKNWKDYVKSKRLEITCGEAPFLTSRYDASTGEFINPINSRIGILDRKLRVVNENTENKKEWVHWALEAVKSCYGYEYQGDSLILARINILLTFVEYFEEIWNEKVEDKILLKLANIISWNIWQMDGLTYTVPFGAPYVENKQISIFDLVEEEKENEKEEPVPCRIFNWSSNKSIDFIELRRKKVKKFDFVIGNPPYQQENKKRNRDDAVYDKFMDNSFIIGEKVLLITPARFLFNVGSTPEGWNKKMLNDEHFKVVKYIQNSEEVFKGTDIKGGVAITYRDDNLDFGAIETFTSYKELSSILKKVELKEGKNNLGIGELIYIQNKLDLEELAKYNEKLINRLGNKGKERRLTSAIFDKLSEIFFDEIKMKDKDKYIQIIGRQDNKRVKKWVKRDFVEDNGNLLEYKVILPAANGSGAIGEVLSTPLIGEPLIGFTQTFISFGKFDTYAEANACMKYIKSKFARTMLGLKKVTQNNKTPETWSKIPIQNFTENSDIDWTKSIPEIDRQLYDKYGLDEEEINFIEEKVQEMK